MSENMLIKQVKAPARAITRGPRQHYFGYYDKRQFDSSGRFDLATEKHELLFSIRKIAERDPHPDMKGAEHYITHPLWNGDGRRFLFWHRWKTGVHKSTRSRLYTANADGTDLYLLHDDHSHTT